MQLNQFEPVATDLQYHFGNVYILSLFWRETGQNCIFYDHYAKFWLCDIL